MDVRRIATIFCVLPLLAAGAWADLPLSDADLAAGVRQVQDGDFEGALVTLDACVQRLESVPSRSKDVAQAQLYLGVAYVALGQRERAKASFRLALARDAALRLGPDRFSPKVRGVFEEVRREAPA